MKQGFLIFAHDNEDIEYGLLALGQAKRIKELLGKPVSVVLDDKTENNLKRKYPNFVEYFDKIIKVESSAVQTKRYGNGDNQLTFHNLDRISSWDLTPYDETIVIDTDVVIQTTNLNKLWNNSEDLLVCDNCADLYGNVENEFTWISDRSIKFYWATVFYFKKTEYTKLFFEHCKRTKEMYGWLSHVYEIPSRPLRNDFVWSIALHELEHPAPSIPFRLLYSNYEDKIIESNNSSIKFLTKSGLCKVNLDVHVFNKYDLMEKVIKDLG